MHVNLSYCFNGPFLSALSCSLIICRSAQASHGNISMPTLQHCNSGEGLLGEKLSRLLPHYSNTMHHVAGPRFLSYCAAFSLCLRKTKAGAAQRRGRGSQWEWSRHLGFALIGWELNRGGTGYFTINSPGTVSLGGEAAGSLDVSSRCVGRGCHQVAATFEKSVTRAGKLQ